MQTMKNCYQIQANAINSPSRIDWLQEREEKSTSDFDLWLAVDKYKQLESDNVIKQDKINKY